MTQYITCMRNTSQVAKLKANANACATGIVTCHSLQVCRPRVGHARSNEVDQTHEQITGTILRLGGTHECVVSQVDAPDNDGFISLHVFIARRISHDREPAQAAKQSVLCTSYRDLMPGMLRNYEYACASDTRCCSKPDQSLVTRLIEQGMLFIFCIMKTDKNFSPQKKLKINLCCLN